MRRHQVVLIILIVICTFLGTAGARATFLTVDFVIPADQVGRFLSTGAFPEKGCFSSFGSFIPPGIDWLAIPGFALHRPLFLQIPSAAVLFVLTLIGIYLLAKECAEPWTGCGAVALFGLSASGMFWAQSFWPRAYPGCYAWIALFIVWWVKRRQPRYLFGALLVLLLGLSVHLELIFAAGSIVIAWLWFRPPIGKWPVPFAVACSLIVWLPYLHFESSRHFIDLRSQLLRRTLPELDTRAAFPGMIEQFDKDSQRFKPFDQPTHPSEPARSVATVIEDIVPSAYVNFNKSRPMATMLLAIGLAFIASSRLALRPRWTLWAGERASSIALVCLSLAVPWLLLAASESSNVPYRQWGLWSLQCVIACVGASFLMSLPRARWIAVVFILAWVVADGKNVKLVAASIVRDGWAGRECAEARICDRLARDSAGKPLRLGYFIIFQGFEMGQSADDPTQKIGIQFDRYLRWRYGIENQTMSVKGFGNDDQYRILQTIPTGYCLYRFKPDLNGFTRIAQNDGFELWKRETPSGG